MFVTLCTEHKLVELEVISVRLTLYNFSRMAEVTYQEHNREQLEYIDSKKLISNKIMPNMSEINNIKILKWYDYMKCVILLINLEVRHHLSLLFIRKSFLKSFR